MLRQIGAIARPARIRPDRAALAQDLPQLHLHGQPRRRRGMRQRHRHRAVGHPRQGARPADLRAARRPGARRNRALHPPRPEQVHQQGRRRRRDPGHRRLRPHRAQVRSLPLSGPRSTACPRAARRLSRWLDDPQGRARGGRAHRADPRDRRSRHRDPDRRAWPLRRARPPSGSAARSKRPARSTGSRSRCRPRASMR